MIRLSHVIYKADNLYKSVEDFKKKGFTVEFGSKVNPHNALIYFSEGPYIEIIQKAPISTFLKFTLKLIGKQSLAKRFERWDKAKKGFFEICFENYNQDFDQEIKILKKYNQKYFITKSKRTDPKNRTLKWNLLFPRDYRLPFFMTYFNIDPKPRNFIHPNGIKKIHKVKYGNEKRLLKIINEMCNDETLNLQANLKEELIILEFE